MDTILQYIFIEPFPSSWLIQDIIALLLYAYLNNCRLTPAPG